MKGSTDAPDATIPPTASDIACWLQTNSQDAERHLAANGAQLVLVANTYCFLWYGDWVWDLTDRQDIGDLLIGESFLDTPRGIPVTKVVSAFAKALQRSKDIPWLAVPLPSGVNRKLPIKQVREIIRKQLLTQFTQHKED